uniref:Uncharacterized protein n=1 Tax=Mycena chlorophos TaxID=658473 RepID=A0ABQ0L121_MYCCL|nr:predicted protein [Mycena chlorophos]
MNSTHLALRLEDSRPSTCTRFLLRKTCPARDFAAGFDAALSVEDLPAPNAHQMRFAGHNFLKHSTASKKVSAGPGPSANAELATGSLPRRSIA